MRRSYVVAATATAALFGGCGSAFAAQGDWYIHPGPAQLTLADKATISVAGAVVPGASYSSSPQTTAVVEVGRELTDNIGVSVTVGLPPKAEARGSGTIAGLGMLGTATYGPAAVTAQWRFTNPTIVQPYVGAGASYMHIFDTSDGVMNGLKVKDTYGPVVQAGAEIRVTQRWGAFLDVKKAWLETDATGTLGGAPVAAKMKFDPVVANAGVSFRF
jgi:outer membrane protein